MSTDNTNNETHHITGADEIVAALEDIPRALANKVLYNANQDILSDIIRDPLKAALPYSNRTKKGIVIKKAKGTKTGVFAGVWRAAYWLRFLEFGTDSREGRRRKGSKTVDKGRITPRPFIVPFITSRDNAVLEATTKQYNEYVVASLKKNLDKVNTKISKL